MVCFVMVVNWCLGFHALPQEKIGQLWTGRGVWKSLPVQLVELLISMKTVNIHTPHFSFTWWVQKQNIWYRIDWIVHPWPYKGMQVFTLRSVTSHWSGGMWCHLNHWLYGTKVGFFMVDPVLWMKGGKIKGVCYSNMVMIYFNKENADYTLWLFLF